LATIPKKWRKQVSGFVRYYFKKSTSNDFIFSKVLKIELNKGLPHRTLKYISE